MTQHPTLASSLRLVPTVAGLFALWVGCSLTNAPLPLGGPFNIGLNALGLPLIAAGVVAAAFAPERAWVLVWALVAAITLLSAGANFWNYLPIDDGAFQALRSGERNPDRAPADAVLHAAALAPLGIAGAALLPGPRRVGWLLLGTAAAIPFAGLALERFAAALPRDDAGWAVYAMPLAAPLVLTAAWRGRSVARAIAGQAGLLLVLCFLLWREWARAVSR